jgi:hypothetical protein
LGGPNGSSGTGYPPTIRKGEEAETIMRESDRFIVEE